MKTTAIAFLAMLVTGCEPPRLSNSPEDDAPGEREDISGEESPHGERTASSDAGATSAGSAGSDDPQDPSQPPSTGEPGEQEASEEPEEVAIREDVSYPITKNLFDDQGRTFRAHILGRSEDDIYVERVDNNNKFTLPIDKLREADQRFLKSLPVTGKPQLSQEDPYLTAREKDIERLRRKLADLQKEVGSGDAGKFRKKRIRTEKTQINQEIAELIEEMKEYRERQK